MRPGRQKGHIWCNLPLALAILATGFLVLVSADSQRSLVTAMGFFFVGLLMIGLRLLFYLQQVEPQYWRPYRHPPNHCRRCGYNLTGNTSGVCPECGTQV